MDVFPDIKQVKPLPHEKVLRLFIRQLEAGYKEGWLYYRCKEENLLEEYNNYKSQGVFNLLEKEQKTYAFPNLTIELVPEYCWFNNVRSNLKSKDWDQLRTKSYKEAGYRCEICGGKGFKHPVECHEIWNYEDESLIQKLLGLISLCPACHEVKHMGLTELKGKKIEATCHLAIVNRWSYKYAEQYIEKQFDVWRYRSTYPWILDISWLNTLNIIIDNKDNPNELYAGCSEDEKCYYMQYRKKAVDLFRLGVSYESKQDLDMAYRYYEEASKLGDVDATFNLAVLHMKRKITSANFEQAIYFFNLASKFGDKEAKQVLSLGENKLKEKYGY